MDELRKATCEVINASGIQMLQAPRRFVGYATDLIDPESVEARVLYAGCDAVYLGHFSNAMNKGGTQALSDAVERATDYLSTQYVIDPKLARKVSWEIAAGIADSLGVSAPSRPDTAQAQAQPAMAPVASGPASFATPRSQSVPQNYVTQDVSVGGYQTSPSVQQPHVPYTPQEPLGWTSSGQPQVQQAYNPVQPVKPKKSHGVLIAIVAGIALCVVTVALAVGVLGGSKDSASDVSNAFEQSDTYTMDDNNGSDETDTIVDQTPVDSDPDEGVINGLNFSQTEVNDSYYGDIKAVVVHNSNSAPLAVTSTSGKTYIESINPNEDGFFLLENTSRIMEDVEVDSTNTDSVAHYLTWSESREGSKIVFTVNNSYDHDLPFDTYFYFVSFDNDGIQYWRTNWTRDADGTTTDTIAPGENTFTLTGEFDVVFDMNYSLYINGVRVERTN